MNVKTMYKKCLHSWKNFATQQQLISMCLKSLLNGDINYYYWLE